MESFSLKDLSFCSSSSGIKSKHKKTFDDSFYQLFEGHPLRELKDSIKSQKTLESLCLAVNKHDESVQEAYRKEITDWIKSLSPEERFDLFVLNDTTVTIIILSMYWKKVFSNEDFFIKSYKAQNNNQDIVISDPGDFEKFFQAKKGMDKTYEEKNASRIKLENEIIENLRLIERSEFFDNVCFSEEFLKDIQRVLDIFHTLSEGKCFSNPCKIFLKENVFFDWIWELPAWFNRENYHSLAVWIISLIERSIWSKFIESKKINRRNVNTFVHTEYFLKKKENLLHFWKNVEKSKKKKIFAEAKSILSNLENSLKKDKTFTNKSARYYRLTRNRFNKRLSVEVFLDNFNTLIDSEQDSKIIDSLLFLDINKVDDIYSLLIYKIYENVRSFYLKKTEEDLLLDDSKDSKLKKKKAKKKKAKHPPSCPKCTSNSCEIKSFCQQQITSVTDQILSSFLPASDFPPPPHLLPNSSHQTPSSSSPFSSPPPLLSLPPYSYPPTSSFSPSSLPPPPSCSFSTPSGSLPPSSILAPPSSSLLLNGSSEPSSIPPSNFSNDSHEGNNSSMIKKMNNTILTNNTLLKTVSDYEEEKNSVVSDTTRRLRTFVTLKNVKKRCNSNSREKKAKELKKDPPPQKFFLESEITTIQDSNTDFESEHILDDVMLCLSEKPLDPPKVRNRSHEKPHPPSYPPSSQPSSYLPSFHPSFPPPSSQSSFLPSYPSSFLPSFPPPSSPSFRPTGPKDEEGFIEVRRKKSVKDLNLRGGAGGGGLGGGAGEALGGGKVKKGGKKGGAQSVVGAGGKSSSTTGVTPLKKNSSEKKEIEKKNEITHKSSDEKTKEVVLQKRKTLEETQITEIQIQKQRIASSSSIAPPTLLLPLPSPPSLTMTSAIAPPLSPPQALVTLHSVPPNSLLSPTNIPIPSSLPPPSFYSHLPHSSSSLPCPNSSFSPPAPSSSSTLLLPLPSEEKRKEELEIKVKDLLEAKINQDLDNFIDNLYSDINKYRQYRYVVFDRLHFLVNCLFPNYPISIRTYGSCATGLDLPTSDIDISITGFETLPVFEIPSILHYILQNLVFFKWIKDCRSISTASIPILKLEMDPTIDFMDFVYPNPPINYLDFSDQYDFLNLRKTKSESIRIKMDISVENINYAGIMNEFIGGISTALVNKWQERLNAMQKIAVFMKYVFNEHGFNNSYKGGLSSYCLVIMIVAFLIKFDLGNSVNFAELILKFLEFYGLSFDPKSTGIDVNQDNNPFFDLNQGEIAISRLTIMDPISHLKSLTSNAFLADSIFGQMKIWYERLMELKKMIKERVIDGKEEDWEDVMEIFGK